MLKLEPEMAASVAASSPLTSHFTSTNGVPLNSTLKVAVFASCAVASCGCAVISMAWPLPNPPSKCAATCSALSAKS